MQLIKMKRSWLILLLPLSMGLVVLAGNHPLLTEQVYSKIVYPPMHIIFGSITSLVPFSIAELLILTVPIALIVYIARQVILAIRHKGERSERLLALAANIMCVLGVGYLLFQVLCGFNYHRQSFAVISGLDVHPSSTEELTALCEELVDSANALRQRVGEDDSGVMAVAFEDHFETAAFARTAYEPLSAQYSELGGYTVRPKPVTLSRGMSYLDITGVYTPFTFEANVNVDVADFWIPSTMMHELAHSKGFMREEEANFLAYLSCVSSGDIDFAYSGTMLALVHSTNALYSADQDAFWQVREQYGEGLERDLAANSAYWKQFEGPVAEVSSKVNDAYLRSNRQPAGVKSYGQMVDLLLAEYRQRHGGN